MALVEQDVMPTVCKTTVFITFLYTFWPRETGTCYTFALVLCDSSMNLSSAETNIVENLTDEKVIAKISSPLASRLFLIFWDVAQLD